MEVKEKIMQTSYGEVKILTKEEIFAEIVNKIKEKANTSEHPITIGLTGGSTPKAFYAWASNNKAFDNEDLNKIYWMCSDERNTPLESEESNFGNADRMMLQELDAPEENKYPFNTDIEPKEAIESFNQKTREVFKKNKCFDICFLGMGDDCHTASIFPGSPLIEESTDENFAAIEVPSKGWRLTITPHGLANCREIVIIVTGKGKAEAIQRIFESEYNPTEKPAQLLKNYANQVTWLIDSDAASTTNLL